MLAKSTDETPLKTSVTSAICAKVTQILNLPTTSTGVAWFTTCVTDILPFTIFPWLSSHNQLSLDYGLFCTVIPEAPLTSLLPCATSLM